MSNKNDEVGTNELKRKLGLGAVRESFLHWGKWPEQQAVVCFWY